MHLTLLSKSKLPVAFSEMGIEDIGRKQLSHFQMACFKSSSLFIVVDEERNKAKIIKTRFTNERTSNEIRKYISLHGFDLIYP
jgi:23S rRNA U2552 (ribose-2'-O)-methylase RlmE/FtsJ